MKKILWIVTVLLVAAGLCACQKAAEPQPENQVNLTYFVTRGKMPESDLALGKDTAALREKIEAQPVDDTTGAFVEEDAEAGVTLLQNENYAYYCKDGTALGAVVSFDAAFTFEAGTAASALKAALSELTPAEGTVPPGSTLLAGMAGYQTLEYAFENAKVCFVFYEDSLCATAFYDPSVFTLG